MSGCVCVCGSCGAPLEVPLWLKPGLSVAEAAVLTGESESSIRRMVRRGELARAPHKGRVIIARAELDRWLTSTMPAKPATDTSPAVVAATEWAGHQGLTLVGRHI